jgi:hypothetical protein
MSIMGMFAKSVSAPNFGELRGEGQSRIWEARVDVPPLGRGFLVRIRGTREGPASSQCEAFGELIENVRSIRDDAAPKIAAYLDSCGIVPPDVSLNASNVWRFLSPEFIEVHDSNEYAMGEGKPGSNAISVGFGLPWDDHLLQLGILQGALDEVYSE